jgi:hypothetical protein
MLTRGTFVTKSTVKPVKIKDVKELTQEEARKLHQDILHNIKWDIPAKRPQLFAA